MPFLFTYFTVRLTLIYIKASQFHGKLTLFSSISSYIYITLYKREREREREKEREKALKSKRSGIHENRFLCNRATLKKSAAHTHKKRHIRQIISISIISVLKTAGDAQASHLSGLNILLLFGIEAAS